MDLIIYHKSCPDGFCSALIAKKRFPEAQLLALDHGQADVLNTLIPLVEGKDVLMVDFSLRTRDENITLHKAAHYFHIFDHHKTAQAELEDLDFATFDMNRSGAGITWDKLFGNYDEELYNSGREIRIGPNRSYIGMPEVQRPWYVDYVQDRDLWKHELPDTKEINAYIMTLPHTETAWRALENMTASEAKTLGAGALAHVEHYVREIVRHRMMGKITESSEHYGEDSYTVAIVNAPYLNISEVGHELTKYADIGMGWFVRGDGIVQFSLRSVGDIDVSRIAKLYNGGGHKNAAGFQMSYSESRTFLTSLQV